MVFSSVVFVLVFLPCVLLLHSILYLHIQNKRDKGGLVSLLNLFLLASSVFFYAWGEPRFFILLLLCSYINFHAGLAIERNQGKRSFLIAGLAVNLGILVYFKYAVLFITPGVISFLNQMLPQNLEINSVFTVALPLGISFYTFQAISYLIDVYRGRVEASQRFVDFACYLNMFPQLVAGPIVRYAQIEGELKTRTLNMDGFAGGAGRFTIGLAKKILIADTLGKVADAAFAVPAGELSALGAWVGGVCYTFQIYYDFSGYSDMAIGMGRMLGFSFPENFNYPYIASSIQNFWQRWHLSLSRWFRDYLYIPLGGNRKSKMRTYVNLFMVFLLCGFWHGASWTFMAWGAYHGFFLVLERVAPAFLEKMPSLLRHIYAMGVVGFGWVLFRADSFSHAFSYLKAMFGAFDGSIQMNRVWLIWHGNDVAFAMFLAILFSFPVLPWLKGFVSKKRKQFSRGGNIIIDLAAYSSLLILLMICMLPLFGATYNAFIYFRF